MLAILVICSVSLDNLLFSSSFSTARDRKMNLSDTLPSAANSSAWYFVRFDSPPDFDSLRLQNITITLASTISKTCFRLFLSPAQITYLISSDAQASPITDKFIHTSITASEAAAIVAETSSTFTPTLHNSAWLSIRSHSATHHHVHSPDIPRALSYLTQLPEVATLTLIGAPTLRNRLGAGYTQNNTQVLDSNNTFARSLNDMNLTGAGTTVAVSDFSLDSLSTYFYDPENPVVPGEFNPDRRKIVYVSEGENPTEVEDHGTHVCGTLAGNSLDEEASRFNGIAPDAKIAFWPVTQVEGEGPDWFVGEMNEYKTWISSASWGYSGSVPSKIANYDRVAFENPHIFFVWADTNDQQENRSGLGPYFSTGSPDGAKNMLSVGALAQLETTTAPSRLDCHLKLSGREGSAFYDRYPDGITAACARSESSADPFDANVSALECNLASPAVPDAFALVVDPIEFETIPITVTAVLTTFAFTSPLEPSHFSEAELSYFEATVCFEIICVISKKVEGMDRLLRRKETRFFNLESNREGNHRLSMKEGIPDCITNLHNPAANGIGSRNPEYVSLRESEMINDPQINLYLVGQLISEYFDQRIELPWKGWRH
jgi:hypothetical protein